MSSPGKELHVVWFEVLEITLVIVHKTLESNTTCWSAAANLRRVSFNVDRRCETGNATDATYALKVPTARHSDS